MRAIFDDPAGWTGTLGGFAVQAGVQAAAGD
jgi:hypothetical protein